MELNAVDDYNDQLTMAITMGFELYNYIKKTIVNDVTVKAELGL